MKKTINITNFEQGSISNTSEYYVKTCLFYALFTDHVTFIINTTKSVKFTLYGYSDKEKAELLCTLGSYTGSPQTINLTSRFKAKYWVIVMQMTDGERITIDDITDISITIENLWYMDSNNEIYSDDMPVAPQKSMVKPYPLSLWRIDYLSPNLPYIPLFPNIKGINMWSLPQKNVIMVYDYREPQDGFSKHNGLAILAPSECTSYQELNGRWDVNLTHPVDNWGRWKTLLPQNILKINGQLFRIDEHTSVSGEHGMYIQVHAKHISYDLADEFVHYYWGENLNGYEFINAMFGACLTDVDHYDKYSFQYNSNLTDRTGQIEITDKSLLNTLIGNDDCLINQLGGELYRNNFYFSINERMEGSRDNAFALKYGFDMTGITQKIDYSELTTWLMVDDNYGNTWSVSYVDGVYPIHHHKHTFKRFSYSADNFDKLVKDGQDLFGQLCRPKVSYEVNIANIKNNPKYNDFLNLQNYNLGDSGTIECELLDIKTTQKIVAIEKNELTGDFIKIKLGNENYSLIRPAYKGNISSGSSPSEIALQQQVTELNFREYISTPITTVDGLYISTHDNKYLIYKE